jgi:hypothetical protein
MAPKKGVVEEKILLGRPGNNLKSGIVGCLGGRQLASLADTFRANRLG